MRAATLAHPEAEWVWWVDSDAVFTDMDFSLPLAKYAGRNFVVYGWPNKFFVRKSWLGLNAGVFLIRNCQWSLDFMDEWARMGPAYPEEHARWGKTLRDALSDVDSDVACDQSALVFLLLNGWERLGKKTFVETDYFQGYWKEVVDRLDGVAARYEAIERRSRTPGLRRRHAEREHLRYVAARNAAVSGGVPGPAGGGVRGWRRPLITHFVGCQPCSGGRKPMYSTTRGRAATTGCAARWPSRTTRCSARTGSATPPRSTTAACAAVRLPRCARAQQLITIHHKRRDESWGCIREVKELGLFGPGLYRVYRYI